MKLAVITNPALPSGSSVQTASGFANYVSIALRTMYIIGGVAMTVILVYGGLMYITSVGDDKALSKAKKIMTDAIIGIIILASTIPIAKILESIFGLNIFNISFPAFSDFIGVGGT
ncbi:hypothetical protein L6255_04030 [Candidatus Parcubacteria bacterium]|nr:hypothetical protein [Patescibacteria group bacterium]MBU4380662.1 hypothetical protein [Patescibacteria group bacterium]MCG2689579.1 hypothetical protein [Candidatus Parcubacteria bacterium]